MVTLSMSGPADKLVALPSREELRAMLNRPAVAIVAIICVTVFGISALAGVFYLAATDHGVEAVGAFILALLGVVWGKLKSVQETVRSTTQDGGNSGT